MNNVLDCTQRVATIPSSPWDLARQLLLGHTKQGSTVRYLDVEMDETKAYFVYRADRLVTGRSRSGHDRSLRVALRSRPSRRDFANTAGLGN